MQTRHICPLTPSHSSTMADNINPTPRRLALLLPAIALFVGAAVASLAHRGSGTSQAQIASLQRQLDELKQSSAGGLLPRRESRNLQSVTSPTCDCPSAFTYASDYGVVGDGVTDDAAALQMAIDAAASNLEGGGTVLLPRGTFLTKSTLTIPGGIKLKGQGYGSSPLAIQFDAGSSVVAYCGTGYAVRMRGHAAALEDVAVYDWRYPEGGYCDGIQAAGGVLVEADNAAVESITMDFVFGEVNYQFDDVTQPNVAFSVPRVPREFIAEAVERLYRQWDSAHRVVKERMRETRKRHKILYGGDDSVS